MYTLPNKLRLFSIIFMVVGAIFLIAGFITTPGTTEEVKEMMAAHGDGHGTETTATHESEELLDHSEGTQITSQEGEYDDTPETMHNEQAMDLDDVHSEANVTDHNQMDEGSEGAHDNIERDASHNTHVDEEAHLEHTLTQLQNKPWSALFIAAFFFFMITLGTLAFYAIQYAAQAGWSPVLFRVMEGITAYLPAASIIIFILLLISSFHFNHLYHWMDPELVDPSSPHYDKLIAGKSSWLNVPFFLIRAAIFLIGWNLYRYFSRKYSLLDDTASDNRYFKKNFKISAGFLVFFIVTESIMSWDWIMSFDPHWFSTLFGWYVFAGMMVCAITVIAMVTIVLKGQGYLEYVNNSHIHDLAKFMFGFSIFWTYLWFSQFMLIWYANIPEEVTYFVTRIEDYKLPFFGMVALNFLFPVLLLMNSDYKRVNWFVIMAGVIILTGQYLNVFVMVMPATVGTSWFIGLPEIGALLFFFGLFVLIVFTALAKQPLIAKNNPFIKESKHYHY